MEYPIVKGLEDPVKVRGFLLSYFYVVLGVALLAILLIIGSISSAAEAGSVQPILENFLLGALMLGATVWIAHALSNKKKFPPMGKRVSGSNLELYRRLRPRRDEIHIEKQQLLSLCRRAEELRRERKETGTLPQENKQERESHERFMPPGTVS